MLVSLCGESVFESPLKSPQSLLSLLVDRTCSPGTSEQKKGRKQASVVKAT